MENDVVRKAVLAEAKKKHDEYITKYVTEQFSLFKRGFLAFVLCLLVIPMGVGAILFSFSVAGIVLGVMAILGGFLGIRYGLAPRVMKMGKQVSIGFEEEYPEEAAVLREHKKECNEKGGCCCRK
jgi:hypothetical protein